ncbi:kinase-like domain-containing protein [Glomus cerebriforme]|uniref:Kinase-like domain-containing protein n=1 Tax=Glomus cerebriforme TaxID=658196 RepID=A0A397SMB2_9GLOM|nr:kinase-like domain-containing protein [Glomus cerebriforme]
MQTYYYYVLWCKSCTSKKNWTSDNENFDNLIQEKCLNIVRPKDILFKWIPYREFGDIREIGKGGFATVHSAIWNDPLSTLDNHEIKKKVALKRLHNSQNMTKEFLNEVKAYYSVNEHTSNILKIYGISRNPESNDYIIVLDYADGGNFNDWINKNYKNFNWLNRLKKLGDIINGLAQIHKKWMVHRDLHTGNILVLYNHLYISDMGLCGEIGHIDESKIYGVMPYVAPEVLRGKPYTRAADIYSFGMIMYFVATGRQPFDNFAHDEILALKICKGIRPEINEKEAPKCYIDLMKECWDSNPDNRPDAKKIKDSIRSFYNSYANDAETDISFTNNKNRFKEDNEIKMQFKKAEEYRKSNFSLKNNRNSTTHSQAIYPSRLLNPFTKNLPKYDNNDNSECLDCVITD